jgi:hypothetical protein
MLPNVRCAAVEDFHSLSLISLSDVYHNIHYAQLSEMENRRRRRKKKPAPAPKPTPPQKRRFLGTLLPILELHPLAV